MLFQDQLEAQDAIAASQLVIILVCPQYAACLRDQKFTAVALFQPQILLGRFLINLRRISNGDHSHDGADRTLSHFSTLRFGAVTGRLGNIGEDLVYRDDEDTGEIHSVIDSSGSP